MSHSLLSVIGAFAQFERDLIRERQRQGIALAKLRESAYTGRKHSASERAASRGESKTALAGELGISRQTLYRYAAGQGSEGDRQRVMNCPCGNSKVLPVRTTIRDLRWNEQVPVTDLGMFELKFTCGLHSQHSSLRGEHDEASAWLSRLRKGQVPRASPKHPNGTEYPPLGGCELPSNVRRHSFRPRPIVPFIEQCLSSSDAHRRTVRAPHWHK